MSDVPSSPLIARICSLEELIGEGIAALEPISELPSALFGFQDDGPAFGLVLEQAGNRLGAAVVSRSERRVAGYLIARAARVGPLHVRASPDAEPNALTDAAYRAIFDRLIFTPPAPDIISFRVQRGSADVDVLWRLAIEGDAVAMLGAEHDAVHVDVIRNGRRGQLAIVLAQYSPLSARELTKRAFRLVRKARKKPNESLVVFSRDTNEHPREITPSIDVRFEVASQEEVRRTPRKFGLGLSDSFPRNPARHHFVGRVNGRAVYWMTCTESAPALGRIVPPHVLRSLAEPMALVSDCRTDEEFRGHSIYPAALQWLASWAKDRGVRTLVLLIGDRNDASVHGAVKAGFSRNRDASQR